jgi:hypothetical protein
MVTFGSIPLIILGILFKTDCPLIPGLTTSAIVLGVMSLATPLLHWALEGRGLWYKWLMYPTFTGAIGSFLCTCVMVYSHSLLLKTDPSDSKKYCYPMFYGYTQWYLICVWILLGLCLMLLINGWFDFFKAMNRRRRGRTLYTPF